jgi:NADH-quinone oxidoreductase subunit J
MPDFFYQLHFYLFGLLAIASALTFVTRKSPVAAALWLVNTMFSLAALYVLLDAHFIGAIQVLVYAGAIMVLFIFVIMLLNMGGETAKVDPLAGQRILAVLLGAGMLAGLALAISRAGATSAPINQRILDAEAQNVSQIQVIGWDMFTKYVYPFELTSFLLLVGAIGVILLTRKRAA